MKKRKKSLGSAVLALVLLVLLAAGQALMERAAQPAQLSFRLEDIPPFSQAAYVELEDNRPSFPEEDIRPECFERYSELDALGRCGAAYACVGLETMPTEGRESIGHVRPTGWHSVRYSGVDGGSLYNRCHLIGFQLTAENANEKNLITGTRYLNVTGMLPFENQVAEYVKSTGGHVLYRVTPVFTGEELVARGVRMEGWSVEDQGASVCFDVYAYNNQPGITIDYATGESRQDSQSAAPAQGSSGQSSSSQETAQYVINLKSGKFHLPDCSGAASITEENRQDYTGTRQSLLDQGYEPCGQCRP